MITHVVLFKLKDRTPESIEKAWAVLAGLKGKVPSLKGLEVGTDVIRSERSYDIALVARFEDLAGLDAYQNHPAHLEVVKYIAGVRESAVAVDYELK
jgi:stress responsive alpha/beta barrel protein